MDIFDLLILGGGPGGYLAAERAAEEGLTVCLFEEKSLGGVCLNEGCMPTKSLLNSMKIYDSAKNGGRFGVVANDIQFDHGKALERKNMVVKQLVSGVAAKLKSAGVTVIMQRGFIGPKKDGLFTLSCQNNEYFGKRLIIAAGSEAAMPPIPGVREAYDAGFLLTNREILGIEALPASLCIIGGGVIGLEMANYFASLGTKVTVLEALGHIAGATDKEIGKILQKNLAKKGITFKLGCKVTQIGQNSVTYEENGQNITLECEKTLMSVGRSPSTKGMGIENIGVETQRGAIVVNDKMETSVENCYAIGDVTGKMMLAHVAYRHAEVAVNNIAGRADLMDYSAVPSVIYTSPEVASCGETAESAAAKGINARETTISMRYSGRYLAEVLGGDGICKLVFDGERLIGLHMISPYASEIIWGAAAIIGQKMEIDQIKKIIFPHPSVSEIIKEGLFEQ